MKLNIRPEDAAPREYEPELIDYSTDIRRLCPCGRMFVPYRSFQRYCCDAHRIKYSKGKPSTYIKKKEVIKKCKECGKEFSTNDSKRHYCSHECYILFQTKRRAEPEKRICLVCGKEFITTHWSKRYCSAECRKKAKE